MNRSRLARGERGGSGHGVPPHLVQHEPGVIMVTCGHCGQTFHTDNTGHADHACLGCCEQHQALQEDIDNGETDELTAQQPAQE